MSRYASPAAALVKAPHLCNVAHNLLLIAAKTDGVEIGLTARMTGDFVDAVQDQTVALWEYPTEMGLTPPDEFYVCTDAGPVGGPVTVTFTGTAYVAAEHVDGEHRLDVATGELIGAEVLL